MRTFILNTSSAVFFSLVKERVWKDDKMQRNQCSLKGRSQHYGALKNYIIICFSLNIVYCGLQYCGLEQHLAVFHKLLRNDIFLSFKHNLAFYSDFVFWATHNLMRTQTRTSNGEEKTSWRHQQLQRVTTDGKWRILSRTGHLPSTLMFVFKLHVHNMCSPCCCHLEKVSDGRQCVFDSSAAQCGSLIHPGNHLQTCA